MNLWYKKALIFILAGISYGAGIFFSNPAIFGFCTSLRSESYICRIPGAINIGWPLLALGQMLAIVAIILLFANAVTFQKWLKFSAFYIPIAVVLDLIIYPIRFSPLTPVLTHSQGVYPFGWLYVLITFGIVFWSFISGRRATS